MKMMMNMTDSIWDEERFQNGKDMSDYIDELGFDGLELLHCGDGCPSFFLPKTIKGVHLRYWNDWLDLWNGRWNALREEYGSLEQAKEIFGGLNRDAIRKPLEEDLDMARKYGAMYVVFHVCDVKTTELFTHHFLHSDEEVVDAAAELINSLLDGKNYTFEFLMENLWWPGLTMTRPEITERLLSQVHYPRKGIMLDTGHLMHTNLELETEEEAVDYILGQVKAHGELTSYIRGIHLNQSLTGPYVRELLTGRDAIPRDYREKEAACYRHVFQIDSHLPFTTPRVKEIVDAVHPEYLTFEFITSSRKEQRQKLLTQRIALGW